MEMDRRSDKLTNPRLTRCMPAYVFRRALSMFERMHAFSFQVRPFPSCSTYALIMCLVGGAVLLLGSCWQPKQESCCVGVVSVCDVMRND